MREYQPRTVHELAACTCDRCKGRLTPEDGEWQERLSFDHSCGFDSVFGDGNTVSLDLCQYCLREVLGQWLRITPPTNTDVFGLRQGKEMENSWDTLPPSAENPREALRGSVLLYNEPTKPVDVAWEAKREKGPRHPRVETFAKFGSDFIAEGRGEHEQAARPSIEGVMGTRYEQDVVAWANEQAALLRAGKFSALDIEHIADEIEDVVRSEQRELARRMAALLAHLLQWQYLPGRRGASWEATIRTQRNSIERRIRKTPSLKASLDDADWWADAWGDAVTKAAAETGLNEFPKACPWTTADVLNHDFFPCA